MVKIELQSVAQYTVVYRSNTMVKIELQSVAQYTVVQNWYENLRGVMSFGEMFKGK